jgi:hypothetical protein
MAPSRSRLRGRVSAAASMVLLFGVTAACSRKCGSSATPPDPLGGGPAIPAIPAIPEIPSLPDLSVPLNVAEGHVESSGSTGVWKLDKGKCWAGDNDGYYGVQIESTEDTNVFIKLVKDPIKGWTLLASIPSTCSGKKCTLEVFQANACKPLDVNFKVHTFRKNGAHQFDGDVTFDCSQDKAHVRGKLTVQRCVN